MFFFLKKEHSALRGDKMANKELTDWGTEVEAIREDYQISLHKLCACSEISRSYYYQIIHGEKKLTSNFKEKIENMLKRLNPDAPLSLLIDYMRVRISLAEDITLHTVCENILKMPSKAFKENGRGLYGYDTSYVCGNIIVYESNRKDMGFLIEMKGLGCRQLEVHLNYEEETWFDFWERCLLYNAVFKRIDLAIDDHYGILDVTHLINRCKQGECVGKIRKFSTHSAGELGYDKPDMGLTLQLGSRQSEIYFCIYEKDYEQWIKTRVPITEAVTKNRFEIRLSSERAEECINQLLEQRYNEDCIENVVFGIINHYVRFCVRPKTNYNGKKQDWDLDVMWEHFINGHRTKLRLVLEPKPFSKQRTLNWLSHQCMPTVKGLLMDDFENGNTVILDMINKAQPGYRLSKLLKLEKEKYNKIQLNLDEKGRVIIC